MVNFQSIILLKPMKHYFVYHMKSAAGNKKFEIVQHINRPSLIRTKLTEVFNQQANYENN